MIEYYLTENGLVWLQESNGHLLAIGGITKAKHLRKKNIVAGD